MSNAARRELSFEELALAFRAFVHDTCERPADVLDALGAYELAEGVPEAVVALLAETEVPQDAGAR